MDDDDETIEAILEMDTVPWYGNHWDAISDSCKDLLQKLLVRLRELHIRTKRDASFGHFHCFYNLNSSAAFYLVPISFVHFLNIVQRVSCLQTLSFVSWLR